MTTCWKGNFIKFSIELYFGICSILDAGEIHEEEAGATRWEQDREDDDDNNEGELGRCFHQAYVIKFRSLEHRKNPNDIGKWRHKRSTFDKWRFCNQTTMDYKRRHQAAWTLRILARRTMASHQWKVCEKVELYDFKWSVLREATRSFILYILIWPSTLHSLIGISSNIVPLWYLIRYNWWYS